MTDFLQQMAAASGVRAAAATKMRRELERRAENRPPTPPLEIGDFGVIAEVKRRSPAEGELASTSVDCTSRAAAYETAGAAAVSVLTEPARFGGSLDDLERVADALCSVPAMRKDFVVDTVQVTEARAHGAGGILLIAAILNDDELARLCDAAREFDMFVLLEAFDGEELRRCAKLLGLPRFARAASAGQILVGVNTRDLRSLQVDPERLRRLAPELPREAVAVAESGVLSGDDAAAVAMLGYGAVLVGTALMRSAEPGALVQSMQEAGANARRQVAV